MKDDVFYIIIPRRNNLDEYNCWNLDEKSTSNNIIPYKYYEEIYITKLQGTGPCDYISTIYPLISIFINNVINNNKFPDILILLHGNHGERNNLLLQLNGEIKNKFDVRDYSTSNQSQDAILKDLWEETGKTKKDKSKIVGYLKQLSKTAELNSILKDYQYVIHTIKSHLLTPLDMDIQSLLNYQKDQEKTNKHLESMQKDYKSFINIYTALSKLIKSDINNICKGTLCNYDDDINETLGNLNKHCGDDLKLYFINLDTQKNILSSYNKALLKKIGSLNNFNDWYRELDRILIELEDKIAHCGL